VAPNGSCLQVGGGWIVGSFNNFQVLVPVFHHETHLSEAGAAQCGTLVPIGQLSIAELGGEVGRVVN
jgi:hypothetical protein